MSKYCMKCGKRLEDGDLFCDRCGAKQEVPAPPAEKEPPEQGSAANSLSRQEDRANPNKELCSNGGSFENSAAHLASNAESGRAPSGTETSPTSPLSQQDSQRKLRHSKKKFILPVLCAAVLCIIAIAVIFFFHRSRGLMDLDDVEQTLNESYRKAWGGYADDYSGVAQFEIQDVKGQSYDQTFSCIVSPFSDGATGLRVIGLARKGKVIQLQSVYVLPEENFHQLDSNAQAGLLAMAMFPVNIFEEDIDTVSKFIPYLNQMEDCSDGTSAPDQRRHVKGDIEFSYMSGYGNGVVLSTFNIRYLPAFSSGFFDEGAKTASELEPAQNGGDPTHTHSYGNWLDDGNGSTHSRSCSCGEEETEAHVFDSGAIVKEPTDTAAGTRTYTCTNCGAAKTETIANLQHIHNYGNWFNDNNGSTHSRSCSCGEKETETHTFDSGKVTKKATSTAAGTKTYTCIRCGATESEVIPKLQHTHSYGSWSDDRNGSTHSRFCSCGEKETAHHSFDSGKITKEPTYSSAGSILYTCTTCGAVKSESIPKLDPPKETDPVTPATQDYDYSCICNYCQHDDGIIHLVLENGVKTDVTWTCSACGKENWNDITMRW